MYSTQASNRTYIEDLERLVQFQPPATDLCFVTFCVNPSGDCIPLAPLGQFPLNIPHSPMIKMVNGWSERPVASSTHTTN